MYKSYRMAEFNPRRVRVAYNRNKHLGYALVEFYKQEHADCALNQGNLLINNEVAIIETTPESILNRFFSKRKGKKNRNNPSGVAHNDPIQVIEYDKTFFDKYNEGISDIILYGIDFEVADVSKVSGVLPCEIGITKYSISQGEIDSYHTLINPGNIPAGRMKQVRWTQNNIHGIEVNHMDEEYEQHDRIWDEVQSFLFSESTEPVIFAKGPTMEIDCVQWLAKKAGRDCPQEIFDIKEIEHLLYFLASKTKDKPPTTFNELFPSEFAIGKCKYHKHMNPIYHCALADSRQCVSAVQHIALKYNVLTADEMNLESLVEEEEPLIEIKGDRIDVTDFDFIYQLDERIDTDYVWE
eukprot:TRINITY_DN554_c0_g3_i6.p1 TRINITY_DN554_c0_g3~~TRINITY_DN554_c0_g3_i6.p1  ORF type:complete len:353 (+),score=73.78 TRINITY_DN554_c0_g3_i6:92-1150(+)